MILVWCVLIALGVYSTIYVIYYMVLFGVHFFVKERKKPLIRPRVRFGVMIPAYNEELLLGKLLKSINGQNYPADLFKAIVIADNCTDRTAQIGLENGAIVIERFDREHRGKGYAIKYALEKIDMNRFDAFVIIDADSIMSKDVLEWFNQAILEGCSIIQCYNGLINPDESWFTRLIDISETIRNEISLASKEKLGFSSYLDGNGMCFSKEILLKYGWEAFTVAEDWEYYAKLIEKGETVRFVKEARIYHQESSSLRQATSQRFRWSGGRLAIAWKYGLRIFYRGMIEGSLRKIDASLPLILPNPSLGMNIAITGFVLSLFLPTVTYKYGFVMWFSSLAVLQFVIFMTGIMYTRNKLSKFWSLFVAPVFLIWKMGIDFLSALGMGRRTWVRTERKL